LQDEPDLTIGLFHAMRRELASHYNVPVIDTVLGSGKGGTSGASRSIEEELERQRFIK
jgi:hypothetical protein